MVWWAGLGLEREYKEILNLGLSFRALRASILEKVERGIWKKYREYIERMW